MHSCYTLCTFEKNNNKLIVTCYVKKAVLKKHFTCTGMVQRLSIIYNTVQLRIENECCFVVTNFQYLPIVTFAVSVCRLLVFTARSVFRVGTRNTRDLLGRVILRLFFYFSVHFHIQFQVHYQTTRLYF